jgi:NAD(P)-dependent dehydrogenase (short-subunit alcohol dehydrogenase family)
MDSRLLVGLGAAAGGLVASLCLGGRSPGPPRGAPVPGLPVDSAGVFVKGNTAVITGAGSGIGRATAIRCASLGMNVVLADNHKGDLVRTKTSCQQAHPTGGDAIVSVPTDVSVLADVVALKEVAYTNFKRVDFLMNNAAIQNNGDASAIAHMDRWTAILSVNLMGARVVQSSSFKPRPHATEPEPYAHCSLSERQPRAQVSCTAARHLAKRWWTKARRL